MSDWLAAATAFVTDGIVVISACTALILVVLRRQLAGTPRWAGWTLLGLVVVGAILRLAIAPRVQVEGVYANGRTFLLAARVFEGPVLTWLSHFGGPFYLTDVVFSTNLVLAVLFPVVLFAHARYVLSDVRCALAAAALVVFLPTHIRMSHSDAAQLPSILSSSFTFVALYTGLLDPSPRLRTICLAALPALCLGTYLARPENLAFAVLDVGAIALCAQKGAPRERCALGLGLVGVASVYSFFAHFLAEPAGTLGHAVTGTVRAAFVFLDVRQNTLVNASITPPIYGALAVAGAIFLYKRRDPARAAFLVVWFACFFAIQAAVVPETIALQARYHVHVLPPMLLLAAAAAPEVLALAPRWRNAVVAAVVASPLVYLDYERDIELYEMREFAFLAAMRAEIPDGCTVLEYQPLNNFGLPVASRVGRVAMRVRDGVHEQAWDVVDSSQLDVAADAEAISPRARATLDAPPACLMVYEGLTCASHRPMLSPIDPVCVAPHEELALEPVVEARFRAHGYDVPGLSGRWHDLDGMNVDPHGVVEGSEVKLALYRARGRIARGAP